MSSGGGVGEPKQVQVLGRVPVTRTLRLDALGTAPAAVAPQPRTSDVLCPGCGASLCDGSRRALFVGVALRCKCGQATRVERA